MGDRHFIRTYPRAPAPEFDEAAPVVTEALDRLVSKVVEACCCDKREASQVVYELAKEHAGLNRLGGKIVVQRVH